MINPSTVECIMMIQSNQDPDKYQCQISFKSGRIQDGPWISKENAEKIMRWVTHHKDYTFN